MRNLNEIWPADASRFNIPELRDEAESKANTLHEASIMPAELLALVEVAEAAQEVIETWGVDPLSLQALADRLARLDFGER